MEADWEVEIGPDAPVIVADWSGFVDLQLAPEKAHLLPEAVRLPGLALALIRLNAPESPVWTAKCDIWPVRVGDPPRTESGSLSDSGEESTWIDPGELDAPSSQVQHGVACYIDLLPKSARQWATPDLAVSTCKRLCERLRPVELRCCRADFIVRQAWLSQALLASDEGAPADAIAITAYITACGATAADTETSLLMAIHKVIDAIGDAPIPPQR